MGLILLCHIIGDFYLQTNKIAEEKKNNNWFLLLHCFLYVIPLHFVMFLLRNNLVSIILSMIIIGGTHYIIDRLKVVFENIERCPKHYLFLIDQILHIISLIVVCHWIFNINQFIDLERMVILNNSIKLQEFISFITATLICWRPAGIFIESVFEGMKIKNNNEEIEQESEVLKIGTCIGVLEREIIFILGIMGQYEAIGFVLAAKSIARYKQLEHKAFAEKYLVGTLLSALIAIGCIIIFHSNKY